MSEKIEVTEATEPVVGKPTGDEQEDLVRAIWAAADELDDCVGLVLVAVCHRDDGTVMATSEFLTATPGGGGGALFLRNIIGEAMDRWKVRAAADVN